MIPLGLDEIAKVLETRVPKSQTSASVRGIVIDSRKVGPGDLFFALPGTRVDGHDFVEEAFRRGAYGCVISRPVDLPQASEQNRPLFRVEDVTLALGKLAGFYRKQLAATIVAVTGSNGKTTVRAMIDHVLSTKQQGRASIKSYNNEIGLPLTILSTEITDTYLVAEVGANAPGEIRYLSRITNPNIAVITSVGESHLEGFETLESIVAEKWSILEFIRNTGCAVINVDHPLLRERVETLGKLSRVTFGLHESADVRVTDFESVASGIRFKLNGRFPVELGVHGIHNAVNAAATFATCRRMKFQEEEIAAALKMFEGLPMRLKAKSFGPVVVLDDSYNSNPASLKASAEVLRQWPAKRRLAVIGDMRELGVKSASIHESAGRALAEMGFEFIVGVGQYAKALQVGVRSTGCGADTQVYDETRQAALNLPARLAEGDVVLVKGSRALQLEHVVSAIEDRWAIPAEATTSTDQAASPVATAHA